MDGDPADGYADYAAAVAAQIDRVFIGGMDHCRDHGGRDLVRTHGGPAALGPLIEFRTSLARPGRVVTWPQFAAVTRYRDQARESVQNAATHGYVAVDGSGIRATEAGLVFLSALYTQQVAALTAYWDDIDAIVRLAGRALEAAAATGGDAFAAMAPPFEPPAASPALLLLNRIGTLRYHRADAHAAAWAAAGYTAASIQAMPAGAARAGVEAATNRLAASPFTILNTDERRALLTGLRALG